MPDWGTVESQRKTTIGVLIAVAVAIVAVVATALIVLTGNDDTSGSSNSGGNESVPEELEQYYDQDIDWDDCDDDECTRVTVPIDYDDPDGDTLELAVKMTPAESDDSRGPLLLNPGGPGAPGIDYLPVFATQASDSVKTNFDLVGFDPRGTGDSTPLKCFDDKTLDEFNASDPTPDSEKEVQEARDWTKRLGQACEKNSGDLAAHVSTEETARDMDILRAVLGADDLDYFGASYGTQLGSTYATLFPENVGRLVLDGAVDPSQDGVGFAKGQNEGFQRALTAYLEECVTSEDCPLGTDIDKAQTKLKSFLDDLDENPMTVGDRELTQGLAMYGIAVTLYNKQSWSSLTMELNSALSGDGAMMLELADLYLDRDSDGTYENNSTEANIAITCMDGQDDIDSSKVESLLPEFEDTSPVFGSFMAWGTMGCADWPIEANHTQPDIDAGGSDPILVIGTTRDPATPYEWSEALTEQLGSGVLLTREGDGHTAYGQGSSCTDDAVDSYLIDGDVPDDGTTCEE